MPKHTRQSGVTTTGQELGAALAIRTDLIGRRPRRPGTASLATANAYVLTAAAGSYSLSGQPAGLTATRKLVAAAGSYTLSGQPAGLTATRKLIAAAGSYTLAGVPAGLAAGRKIAAAAGSYSLSGSAAGLKTARVLASAAGVYALSGRPATLAGPSRGGAAATLRRWHSKPPQGWPIDPTHPLAQGLVAILPLNEGAGAPWSVAGRPLQATSNTATWTPTPYGAGLSYNGTSQWTNLGTMPELNVAGPITVMMRAAPTATPLINALDNHNSPSNSAGWLLGFNISGNGVINWYLGATNTNVASSAGATDGNWHVFGVSQGATGAGGVRFYRDGAKWGVANQASMPTANTTNASLGARVDGTTRFMNGPIAWAAVWNRALSDQEHATLATDPWQAFAPRRQAFATAASAGTYSLGAASGTYSVAGSAAVLAAARRLAAIAGTYSLSGGAAALAATRRLVAAAGSYSLAGDPAGLAAGRKLPAAAGAYTLTGRPASLLKGSVVVAAPGAYALSGQSASLIYSGSGRILTAAAGSYSVAGHAAALAYARKLAAAAGSYTLTGDPATLAVAHRIVAAPGSYGLSGAAAALVRGRAVVAAAGPYSLAGAAAAFGRTRAIAAAPGSYGLSGQAATLAFSGAALAMARTSVDYHAIWLASAAADPSAIAVLAGAEIVGSAAYIAAKQAQVATPTAADQAGEVLDWSFATLAAMR